MQLGVQDRGQRAQAGLGVRSMWRGVSRAVGIERVRVPVTGNEDDRKCLYLYPRGAHISHN